MPNYAGCSMYSEKRHGSFFVRTARDDEDEDINSVQGYWAIDEKTLKDLIKRLGCFIDPYAPTTSYCSKGEANIVISIRYYNLIALKTPQQCFSFITHEWNENFSLVQ